MRRACRETAMLDNRVYQHTGFAGRERTATGDKSSMVKMCFVSSLTMEVLE